MDYCLRLSSTEFDNLCVWDCIAETQKELRSKATEASDDAVGENENERHRKGARP